MISKIGAAGRCLRPLLLLAVLPLAQCSADAAVEPGPDSEPVAGVVFLRVTSPDPVMAAALIEVQGASRILAVTSDSARVILNTTADRMLIALIRSEPGTLEVRLDVSDVAFAYAPLLRQLADMDNVVTTELTGFGIEVRK